MSQSVFSEIRFWLMVMVSVVLPVSMYIGMLKMRTVSRMVTLALGFVFILIAGLDVYFLQLLAEAAKMTPSLADDAVFVSEVSLALYLLPALFAGVGVNVISHVLVSHLADAQRRCRRVHRRD